MQGQYRAIKNSVETSRDECSGVGEKNELLLEVHGNLKKVEEIVRAVEMVN